MFGAWGRVKEKYLFNNGQQSKKQQCHKPISVKAGLPCLFLFLHLFSKYICLGILIAWQLFVCLFFILKPQKKNKKTPTPPNLSTSDETHPVGAAFPPRSCPPPAISPAPPAPNPGVSVRAPQHGGLGKFNPSSGAGRERSVLGTAVRAAVEHRQRHDRSSSSRSRRRSRSRSRRSIRSGTTSRSWRSRSSRAGAGLGAGAGGASGAGLGAGAGGASGAGLGAGAAAGAGLGAGAVVAGGAGAEAHLWAVFGLEAACPAALVLPCPAHGPGQVIQLRQVSHFPTYDVNTEIFFPSL